VLVKDKYPAYVSWEDFERIGMMLDDNRGDYQRRMSRGVPRDGKVLLQGIAYCGHCGRKLTIQYKDKPRYNCSLRSSSAGEPMCQFIWSEAIDHHVLGCFFEALSVAEIDLSARTWQESDRRRDEVLRAQFQQLERLRYNAQLAERQYRHSEPENRLVTAELERRWEESLRELQQAEESLAVQREQSQCWAIPADLLEMLKDIGPRLPELWEEQLLTWSQKKALLRCLIEKVVLKRNQEQVDVRVVWRGGDVTELTVPVTVGRFEQLSNFRELEDRIVAMAKDGQTDKRIAASLTKAGHRSPRSDVVLPTTVARIRRQHGIVHPERVCRPHVIHGYLRPYQLAQRLQIRPHWISDRIRNGTIQIQKNSAHKAFLFPDTPETLKTLQQLVDGKINSVSF
jgi:hypothetical protein